jgi:hypothetical protein
MSVHHHVTHRAVVNRQREEWVPMKCVECGALATEVTQTCANCGAPVLGVPQALLRSELPTEGDGAPPSQAQDGTPWPAPVRWLLLACLIGSLILLAIAQVGVVDTGRGTGMHATMVGLSWIGVLGALLFLVLFESARKQFDGAQAGWALTVLCSFGFLAWLPFLWLALARRRIADWVVFVIYLAATITVIAALSSVPSTTSITGIPAATWTLLLVGGPVHAVLAYSRAANVPTWREVYRRWAPGQRRNHLQDAVIAQDRQPDD